MFKKKTNFLLKKLYREIANGNQLHSDFCNNTKLISNGVSTSKQKHSSTSYSSRTAVDCSSCVDSWIDGLEGGDVISYCPTHRAQASPISSRLANPLEDGWSLFSSPSQGERLIPFENFALFVVLTLEGDSPPALPEKTKKRERHPSQYDNVPDSGLISSLSISEHHSIISCTEKLIVGDEVDSRQVTRENNSSQVSAALSTNLGKIFWDYF